MATDDYLEALWENIRQYEEDALVLQRVEAKLLDSPRQFKSFMEKAAFSVEIYSLDGVQLEVNERWKNIYRVHPRETVGKFNALQDKQAVALGSRHYFEQVLAGRAVRGHDYEFDPALSGFPGRKRRLRPVFYPLKKRGKVSNLVITHEDITGRQQTKKELLRHSAHLEQLLKMLSLELEGANGKVHKEIAKRLSVERENKRQVDKLKKALARVEAGQELLSICASCKKIVDSDGKWQQLEAYIHKHYGIDFTHGLCPECYKTLYPDFYNKK